MTVKQPERLMLDRLTTPIGVALLVFDDAGYLRALEWEDHEDRLQLALRRQHGHDTGADLATASAPEHIVRALESYFGGDLTALDAIPCRTGGTAFQQNVWNALRTIPAGQTLSYGTFAAKLSVPRATRAVGHANGANPISVVVPCHRLIGTDGTLTGYGGGLERKRWLLLHEGAMVIDTRKASSIA
jgi:methylated-DNA-[protein]-cysteine S-methyltransferase